MIRVPVDAAWVCRMAELADGPWTVEAVEAAFLRYGWTGPFTSPEGVPEHPPSFTPWCDHADLIGVENRDTESGWTMYFYEAPPSEDDPDAPVPPDQGMALVCAEYWPPASMEDIWMTDTGYHPSEDWDEMRAFAEGGAAWITELEARRPDFVAEFDRIRELVRDVFGEPTQVMQRADGMACAVWERGATALALIREANAWDYEVYDWLVLRVLPRQGVEGLAEDF